MKDSKFCTIQVQGREAESGMETRQKRGEGKVLFLVNNISKHF